VRDARLDAKIDLQKNIVTMNKPVTSIHQTISDRSKQLLERAQYVLPAPATSGGPAGFQDGGHQDRRSGGGKGQQGQRRDNQGIGQGQAPRPVEIKS
jgi:hypothetical protein